MRDTRFFIVPTPIGNLKDMTIRAKETLEASDIIFAEDTRTAMALMNHLGLKKRILSCHKDNEQQAVRSILDALNDGLTCSLVSEAGTPCISDPGAVIIEELIRQNVSFEVLPGATALIPAFIQSGFSRHPLYFHGFLPHKKGERDKEIAKLKKIPAAIIFYESPYRVKETVGALLEAFPAPVSISRELTKMFEETLRVGSVEELENLTVKGEFVLVVNNAECTEESAEGAVADFATLSRELAAERFTAKQIVTVLKALGMKRNAAYQLAEQVIHAEAE